MTFMLPRQRLPVQVIGSGQARFARAFATAVLMPSRNCLVPGGIQTVYLTGKINSPASFDAS